MFRTKYVRLFSLFPILLLAVACGQPGNVIGIDKRPLIVFDAFKEQVWPIRDTGYAGYSSFNLFLKNLGYYTAENNKPYDKALKDLGHDTIFVIPVAMEVRFTNAEVQNILEYVGRGGNVLVIAEHDNAYHSSDFLRPIAQAGGWDINDDGIIDPEGALPDFPPWIRTMQPLGKEGPVMLHASSLTMGNDRGEVLLTTFRGDRIVGGLGRYKRGRLAILSDSEFLWNGNPEFKYQNVYPMNFCDPKTGDFMKQVVFRLFPPKSPAVLDDFPFSDESKCDNRVIVYGNGGNFIEFTKFLTALTGANLSVLKYREGMTIKPEDKVIVISPLKTIPQNVINDLSVSKKIAVFGDMFSSLKSYAPSWSDFFKPMEFIPVPYPANALAEKYGVRFLPFFGVNFKYNEYNNFLYFPVDFQAKRFFLHKACAVELLAGKRDKTFVFKNAAGAFACGSGLGLNDALTSKNPNDISEPDFLIANETILACGDSDVISNAFISDTERVGLLGKIVDYLKN
ncbi:MAG: DUF4350 domain-containing protein [Spirochaetales bacterium]|nr:DUF4350 domain-containing protein [Spirochaetales bacterium]